MQSEERREYGSQVTKPTMVKDSAPFRLRPVAITAIRANFVVKYTKNRTNNVLNGLVACELSERTHGVQKWWVRVEKAAS